MVNVVNVFDDGSEVEIVIEPDDPPKSGVWVDHEQFYDDMTPEELAEGDRLGREIDVDNDWDTGL